MLFSIGVAGQTSKPGGRRRFSVARMTSHAVAMLFDRVKSRQTVRLMAARAGRRRRHAARPVRSVTIRAALGRVTVCRRGFVLVAAGTGHVRSRTAVRLMAGRAVLVSARRGLVLLDVAAPTVARDSSSVWLVTVRAGFVTSACAVLDSRMAGLAACIQRRRSMGEATVTTFARLVPGQRGR